MAVKSSFLRVDAPNSREIQISRFLLTGSRYLLQQHNKKTLERFGVQKIFLKFFSKLTISTQTLKTTVKLFLEFAASTFITDDLKNCPD